MPLVITRYFDSVDNAQLARNELVYRRRLSGGIVHLFDDAKGLAGMLAEMNVDPSAAKTYESAVKTSGAVLLVQAGAKPLGVARITREVTADMGATDLGDMVDEVFVKDAPRGKTNTLTDYPLLTRAKDPNQTNYHMADWPIPLISRRKPAENALFPSGTRIFNMPMPLLLDRKPFDEFIFPRHARMADRFLPLLSKRKPYTNSIIAPHARMANFPLPLTSRRKPFTRSIIARHARMANWPFPHLINGKTHTNSLMPNAPRMANFPIPLLSRRKPYTKSIFGRHARMASFPIGLLSQRKPYTGSAIPKHGRMADAILPLVIRRSDTTASDGGTGFSFSKFIGMRTISRR